MYKLLLKVHNKTNLMYLCMTTKENHLKYTGSGVHWKRHLKKHGNDVSTYLLYQEKEKSKTFVSVCLFYSDHWNVVDSPKFANLMKECGNTTRRGIKAVDEVRKQISNSLRTFYGSEAGDEARKHLRNSRRKLYGSEAGDEVRKRISDGLKRFYESEAGVEEAYRRSLRGASMMNSEKGEIIKENIRVANTKHWSNSENRALHSEKISIGRLNMSQEAKKKRAILVSKTFQTSEAWKKYVEKERVLRLGGKNPNARGVVWGDLRFSTRAAFHEFCKKTGISKSEAREKLLSGLPDYKYEHFQNREHSELLTCDVCKKQAHRSSAFLRWHFQNCRKKT